MSMNNGPLPTPEAVARMKQLVEHPLPQNLLDATFITSHVRNPRLAHEMVVLVLHREGASFSLAIEPDLAMRWGEQLIQTARLAKTGLITP